jgi:hypothetical protein
VWLRSGHTPALLAVGMLCLAGGALSLAYGRRVARSPLPEPPPATAIAPDDPRHALPLGQRRRTWLIGSLVWATSLLAATALAWALTSHSSAVARIGIFLGLPTAALALSSWQVRLRNGTTEWPR